MYFIDPDVVPQTYEFNENEDYISSGIAENWTNFCNDYDVELTPSGGSAQSLSAFSWAS